MKPELKLNTSLSDLTYSDSSESTDLTSSSPITPSTSAPQVTQISPANSSTHSQQSFSSKAIRFSRRVLDRFGNVVESGAQATGRKLGVASGNNSNQEAGPITRQKNNELLKNKWSNDSLNSDQSSDNNSSNNEEDEHIAVEVPQVLQIGVPLLRVTQRKKISRTFCINPDSGLISWDSKLSHRLRVDNIIEIRVDEDARNYREGYKVSSEYANQWASIMYRNDNNKLKSLHVVGLNKNDFDLFIGTLKKLVKYRQDLMSGFAMPGDRFVNVHWFRLDKDEKERLSFDDVFKMTKKLHINCSRDFLQQKFDESDVDNSGSLDFKEFQNFVKLMKRRNEVCDIFNQHADEEDEIDGEKYMTYWAFKEFVLNVQRQEEEGLDRTFEKYSKNRRRLGLEEFTDILVSNLFSPLKQVEEDMTRPLNEYFISSSHNTYLLGRQVAGPSSVEAYVRALQNGCRCVEIDCWDGESGPSVCHGALTSSIEFTDVVQTIRKYGFISSPYPLIISLEVRCNAENQLKMVEILKDVLGEQLITSPLDRNSSTLPSPEELKHRFVIKVKSTNNGVIITPLSDMSTGSDTFFSTTSSNTFSSSGGGSELSVVSDDEGKRVKTRKKIRKKKHQPKIIQELSELGVYCSGLKFRNFSAPIANTLNHIFSLSERAANSMMKDSIKCVQMDKHNRKFLMRVYPSAYRITSKNFDPIQYWKRGVQMVALNWQTNDIPLQINDAMFDTHVGYVTKPSSLVNPEILRFDQWVKQKRSIKYPTPISHCIGIEVLSAQQLPRPKGKERLTPHVEVDVFGGTNSQTVSLSTTSLAKKDYHPSSFPLKKFKTNVANNGFNPIWGEKYEFNIDNNDLPLTFVRFAVYVGETCFAVYTVRLVNLMQGYRHLPLHDLHGEEYIFSTLFIKSEVTDVYFR